MFIVLPLKNGKRRIIDTKNIISITEEERGLVVQHRIGRSYAWDVVCTTIDQLAAALKAGHAWREPEAGGLMVEDFKNASPDCHTGS